MTCDFRSQIYDWCVSLYNNAPAKDGYNMTTMMNLKELKMLASSIRLHRKGNYTEIILQGEREGLMVLAYSYTDLIGLVAPNKETWVREHFISHATSQHINMFKVAWGIK